MPLGQSAKGEAQGAQDETRALLFPASPQGVPPFQVTLILPSWLLGRETKVVPAASFGPSSPSLLHLPQCSCHLPQQEILLQGFYTQLPCGRAHRLSSLLDTQLGKGNLSALLFKLEHLSENESSPDGPGRGLAFFSHELKGKIPFGRKPLR